MGGLAGLSVFQPLVLLACFLGVALMIRYLRRTPLPAVTDELFDTAPGGYLEVDTKGTVRRVNRRECELRGLALREIVGKPCWDLSPPADRQRFREQTERRLTAQVALVPYQRENLHPNGTLVAVEVHEHLLHNRAGRVVGLQSAAVDMSER